MLLGNIEIKGILYPIKIQYRKKQSRGISASGVVKVLTVNTEELLITLKVSAKEESVANAIISYIRTTANYSQNVVSLTPDSAIDLGNGKGIPVQVRYWSDNFDFDKNKENLFDFEFVFRKENI